MRVYAHRRRLYPLYDRQWQNGNNKGLQRTGCNQREDHLLCLCEIRPERCQAQDCPPEVRPDQGPAGKTYETIEVSKYEDQIEVIYDSTGNITYPTGTVEVKNASGHRHHNL